MPRRIDLGRIMLIVGAALLLVSLFLKWYDTGPTGWEVFESLDLVLAGLALATVVAGLRAEDLPRWAPWAIPAVALVIVVVQLINPPPAAGNGDPASGAWMALAGSLLMTIGGGLSLSRISVTVQVRERDLRPRVPAVDRRRERERERERDAETGADPVRPASSTPPGLERAATPGGRSSAAPGRAERLLSRDEPSSVPPSARERVEDDRTQPLAAIDLEGDDAPSRGRPADAPAASTSEKEEAPTRGRSGKAPGSGSGKAPGSGSGKAPGSGSAPSEDAPPARPPEEPA